MSTVISQEELLQVIKDLQELGQRLDSRKQSRKRAMRPSDWFVCANAAGLLEGIRNGFRSLEPRFPAGFDQRNPVHGGHCTHA